MAEGKNKADDGNERQRWRIPAVSQIIEYFRDRAGKTASRIEIPDTEAPDETIDSNVLSDADLMDVDFVSPVDTLDQISTELPPGRFCDIIDGIIEYTDIHNAEEIQRLQFNDGELIIDETESNNMLYIVTRGGTRAFTCTVQGDNGAGACIPLSESSGLNIIGEITAAGLSDSTNTPTASVAAVGDTEVIAIPQELFRDMLTEQQDAREAVLSLAQERLAQQRDLRPTSFTDAATAIAELRSIAVTADSVTATPLRAIADLAEQQPNVFQTVEVAAGETIIEQDTEIDHVFVILSGIASIHDGHTGEQFATAEAGSPLGEKSALSPGKKTSADVRAESPCILLRMPARVFQQVRREFERIVHERRDEAAEPNLSMGTTMEVAATPLLVKTLAGLTEEREHYTAPALTANAGTIIPAADADQMLMLLSRRDALKWRGTTGWEIKEQPNDSTYTIGRAGDNDITIGPDDFEEFRDENLDEAFPTESSIRSQLELYREKDFDQESVQFLVGLGYVLNPEASDEKIEQLKERLPGIRRAAFYVRRRLGSQSDNPNPLLADSIEQLLVDVDYPLTVTAFLQNEETQERTLNTIIEVAQQAPINEAQFQKHVFETFSRLDPAFTRDDHTKFNLGDDGQTKVREDRDRRLGRDSLYGIGDKIGDTEIAQLQSNIDHRNTTVEPTLVAELEEICSLKKESSDGFPVISSRTKTAAGVADKVRRMRAGNGGKAPRPEYIVADIPDITGGRIVARDTRQLEGIMQKFEEKFNGRILEKDNFYSNERKRQRPYRVITYTVEVEGDLCEVQLTTLAASIAADINHNTIYKPLAATSLQQQDVLNNIMRQAAILDTDAITQHQLDGALNKLEEYDVDPIIRNKFRDAMDYKFTLTKFVGTLNASDVYTEPEKVRIKHAINVMGHMHRGHTYEIPPKNGVRKYPTSTLLAHVPYTNHCVRAAQKALEHGESCDTIITILYHDAQEDQAERWEKASDALVPPFIKTQVNAVSEQPGQTRDEYMEHVRHLEGIPRKTKIYDRYDNLLRGFLMLRSSYLYRTIEENESIYIPLLNADPEEFPAEFKERFMHLHDNLKILAAKVKDREDAEAEV